jgi:hypothetical protein
MTSAKWTLLTRILVCTLLATTIAGCSLRRANKRIAYWTKETTAHIPVGTPIDEAKAFLASRGLDLRCCMSFGDADHAYWAMERDIGQFIWMEYNAEIAIEVTPDQRVSRVRVYRIGVGP